MSRREGRWWRGVRPRTLSLAIIGVCALLLAHPIAAPPSVAEAREGQPLASSVLVVPDLVYASRGDEALRMDAYLPRDGRLRNPAVVVIHGGAWSYGDKSAVDGLARNVAQRGMAAFAVDYRKAPEHRYPAAVDDVEAAVEYIRSRAIAFDVDPNRIGAIGTSAGGHLAAMLATRTNGATALGSGITVAVSWSGPMDLASIAATDRGTAAFSILRFLGCTPTRPCRARLRDASPITHVSGGDAAMLFFNSDTELVPVDQARAMGEALKAKDVPHRYVELPGSRHGKSYASSGFPGAPPGTTVMDASLDYLESRLS